VMKRNKDVIESCGRNPAREYVSKSRKPKEAKPRMIHRIGPSSYK
jgi:hypothetical protein